MFLGCSPRIKINIQIQIKETDNFDILAFKWLWRIEPNSTKLFDPRIKSKPMHPWAFAENFPRGQRRNFAYPFQVADDAMWMDVHKTLYPFNPINVCWLNLILNRLHDMFSTLRLSEMLFLFINCLISIFEHFLQISHNLRIINGQNNMSGEITRKSDTLVKLFQAMRSRTICWQDYRTTY